MMFYHHIFSVAMYILYISLSLSELRTQEEVSKNLIFPAAESMAHHHKSSFIKLITRSSIEGTKMLRIPKKFAKKFGNEFSSVARLRVPNGFVWHVGLQNTGNNKFWFHNGWEVFVKYYSIKVGHLLIFKYEGNSNFDVFVFDLTEINYPPNMVSNLEEPNQLKQYAMAHEEEMDEDDESVEILGSSHPWPSHISLGKSEMPNSRRSSSSNCDKFSQCSTEERQRLAQNGIQFSESKLTESTDEVGLHLQDEAKQIIETSKRQIQRSEPNKHASSAKRKKEKETTNDNIKTNSRVSTRTRPVTTQEKQRARFAATSFNSSNPFCMVIMMPSHVYRVFLLHMPSSFAKKYLSEGLGSIKLETCDGKRWPVRCIKSVNNSFKLSRGWTDFVYDNNLEEDDVCVFELIQVNDIVLKVTIFRVLEDDTAPPTKQQPQISIDLN